MQAIKSWWESRTADQRRLVVGVGMVTLLIVVLYLFMTATPQKQATTTKDPKPDVNLLTGSDTKRLGIESLSAEIRDMERKNRDEKARLNEEDRLLKQTLEDMKGSIVQLKQELSTTGQSFDKRLTQFSTSPTGAKPPSSAEDQEHPLFLPKDPRNSAGSATPGMPGVRSALDVRGGGNEPSSVQIQVYGENPHKSEQVADNPEDSFYVPAASILSGVLITGVDAPTGLESKRDPMPTLVRIKHEAILPNHFKADIKECHLIFGSKGELSTERVDMRAEVLSCVRRDGEVIETPIDAYAVGDDGKVGLRGRLVHRNGSLIAKAAAAGFAEAFAKITQPIGIQSLNTSPGKEFQFQAPNLGEAAEAGVYSGAGNAMKRLADYYVKMADQIVPFIEVDAGVHIEAVLLKGVRMKIVKGGAAK